MSLTSVIDLAVRATLIGSPDLGQTRYTLADGDWTEIQLASGTGNNAADLIWSDERSLNASTTEDLDLSGSLTQPDGSAAVFAKVKAILIEADSANPSTITIFGDANGFVGPLSAATVTLALPANGRLALVAPIAGWAVTAGTGDIIQVANNSGAAAATYRICVIGTSA